MANYGHSRKKHNFARTFFAKNKPLTTTYTFLDWNKTNLEKKHNQPTSKIIRNLKLWLSAAPPYIFCISYFWKMEKQNRKMSVNEFIIQYCTLWKITYSNFKCFAQNCKKNTASISFSIYLSLKSPPTLIRIYGLSMCFSFKILSR